VVVEGAGGMSTVISDTCVGIQNGESSRDGALRYQKPLTPPNSTSKAVKATLTTTTPSSLNPTLSPSARVYIGAFFTRHSMVLAVVLLVTVSIAAGVIAGIVAGIVAGFRWRCLAIGFGVAAVSFVLITALFALLRRREEREEDEGEG
jgi:MFS family permease